jgi:FKBP-type peptidyl-prolyl cis-trans isomerase FkpA
MKKMLIAAAASLVLLVGCNKPEVASKTALQTEAEKFSYLMGMTLGKQLKDAGKQQGDSIQLDQVMSGIQHMLNIKDTSKSFLIGLDIGAKLKQMAAESDSVYSIDAPLMMQALQDAFKGDSTKKLLLNDSAAGVVAQAYQMHMMAKQQAKQQAEMSKLKGEGDAFLAANKSKPNVVTTASGLQYEILTKGTGAVPTDKDQVKVHYKGTLLDGTVFDETYTRGEPATMSMNGIIKGWVEALKLMPVGSKFKLWVPYTLAYGEQGVPFMKIPPFATLTFEVELLEATPDTSKPVAPEMPAGMIPAQ